MAYIPDMSTMEFFKPDQNRPRETSDTYRKQRQKNLSYLLFFEVLKFRQFLTPPRFPLGLGPGTFIAFTYLRQESFVEWSHSIFILHSFRPHTLSFILYSKCYLFVLYSYYTHS